MDIDSYCLPDWPSGASQLTAPIRKFQPSKVLNHVVMYRYQQNVIHQLVNFFNQVKENKLYEHIQQENLNVNYFILKNQFIFLLIF
jgi:hypothetical protein